MIFVMVGTQKQDFSRLFKLIDDSKILKDEKIIAQSGYTKYISSKIECIPFMSHEELIEYIKKADLIICHGGVGTIFDSLYEEKKILAIPRLSKFKEHKNDHQLEICEELEKEGYIKYLKENDSIDNKLLELKKENLKKYVSNDNYIHILKKEI